ncbi:MAG TPA: alkaline phosphatase family protein [Actinomycetota bacterium]|nr:alkaline phosphatase family protein [Actinomycetota bacterium]
MADLKSLNRSTTFVIGALIVALAVVVATLTGWADHAGPLPSFEQQACGLPHEWLVRTQRGYFEPRSGQISLLPRTPAYMASGGGGWSHSGPWPYLEDIPIVFYGPGFVEAQGDVDRPVTTADIAPTEMALMHGFYRSEGEPLPEVARLTGRSVRRGTPKLILTVVWDGGGWNVLNQWPDDWPNLARLMREGVSYTHATVGSSPSVTPATHTTLGTGDYPWVHGITGVPVRDENGEVVDSFLKGESSHFLQVPTMAERWDTQNDNKALVGMVGYEPWHLGMIGQGAERPGGDKDDAAWLNIETNEWITNADYYRLPPALVATDGLDRDLRQLDARDGQVDGAWRDNAILDQRDRVEETPAFIRYHTRGLENVIRKEGYGSDDITDLMFTNYKQIDRVGHYFNMASEEVHDSLIESDRALGHLVDFLNKTVGKDGYVLAVTADHGQQPDASAINAYGIDPREVESDIDDKFGPITRAVWPTEAFLLDDEMQKRGVTVDEVARFLGDYRLRDNTQRPDMLVEGAGRFDPGDRIFQMAIPSALLPHLDCGAAPPGDDVRR